MMANKFGARRGIKLSKTDVDHHNNLREALYAVLHDCGKQIGYKVPDDFPKPLDHPVPYTRKRGRTTVPFSEEDARGWVLTHYEMYLFKWTIKVLHAFNQIKGWHYDIE